eukprot:6194887-Pleurochrysis_carterae.AAC.3
MTRSRLRGAPDGTGSRIPSKATRLATVIGLIPWKGTRAVNISQQTTPEKRARAFLMKAAPVLPPVCHG